MSRLIDADALSRALVEMWYDSPISVTGVSVSELINKQPTIDIVRCEDCRKSHIDGKTTHYLWCTEWGRSTDVFGYCERGEREGER